MTRAHHFVTGKFISRTQRLTDIEYAAALDSLVIACVDCVLTCKNEILIGRRMREPQADWWVIGGRMQPGETFAESAARHCRRELSLTIAPDRFRYLNTVSQVWGRRAQPPQENGCHTVAITMTAEVTPTERAAIKPNDEYRTVWWLPLRDVATEKSFHQSLRQCAKDAWALLNHPSGKKNCRKTK